MQNGVHDDTEHKDIANRRVDQERSEQPHLGVNDPDDGPVLLLTQNRRGGSDRVHTPRRSARARESPLRAGRVRVRGRGVRGSVQCAGGGGGAVYADDDVLDARLLNLMPVRFKNTTAE